MKINIRDVKTAYTNTKKEDIGSWKESRLENDKQVIESVCVLTRK